MVPMCYVVFLSLYPFVFYFSDLVNQYLWGCAVYMCVLGNCECVCGLRQTTWSQVNDSLIHAFLGCKVSLYYPSYHIVFQDLAQLIVERPTIVGCVLPRESYSEMADMTLAAMIRIFSRHLQKALKTQDEGYSWVRIIDDGKGLKPRRSIFMFVIYVCLVYRKSRQGNLQLTCATCVT